MDMERWTWRDGMERAPLNSMEATILNRGAGVVNASDGMRRGGGTPRVTAPPVRTWYDSEARDANKAWQRLRFRVEGAKKRGTLGPDLEFACAAARKRFRRIRAEKKKQFAKEWERFWEDVRCDML